MAVAAEEHGREILEVYLQAMRGGDWRAAERTGLCALIDGGEGGYFQPRAREGRLRYQLPSLSVVRRTPLPPGKADG
jgi:hypothetical protein